jgi:hypothetical protein
MRLAWHVYFIWRRWQIDHGPREHPASRPIAGRRASSEVRVAKDTLSRARTALSYPQEGTALPKDTKVIPLPKALGNRGALAEKAALDQTSL